MSTLYRAIWTDGVKQDGRAAVDQARHRVSQWALDDEQAGPLVDGETTVNRRTLRVSSLVSDDHYGFEVVATDRVGNSPARHEVWTTQVRVVSDANGVHTWVENSLETDDLARRVTVGRPRLVDDLLALPGTPKLGGSAVFTDVLAISAEEVPVLVEILRSPERTLPVIVFTEGALATDRWADWAEKVARRAGGVATVVRLDENAVTAFRRELGDLSVWGGGTRTYVPAPLEDDSDGWRHRYVPVRRMLQSEVATINRIVYNVTQLSTRRRVPAVLSMFDERTGPSEEPLELKQRLDDFEYRLEVEYDERNGVERDLAKAIGHLDRLKRKLSEQGLDSIIWELQHEDPESDDPPEAVQDTSDAVAAAQLYLSDWVVVPKTAPQDLDGIDSGPNAYAWGNTTWRGFRSLAAFAESRATGYEGDFWHWCKRGEALAWPATSKKLAMTESETIRSNDRFTASRTFPVSSDVDSSGSVIMWSHLKISEGGGDLAPRVYFFDDTGGKSQKIHIGFVGPHYLVPNTKA